MVWWYNVCLVIRRSGFQPHYSHVVETKIGHCEAPCTECAPNAQQDLNGRPADQC